jgi:hypothetical protein
MSVQVYGCNHVAIEVDDLAPDPFDTRIDVVDLRDESLVWLLPYQEVQDAGIRFGE